MAVFKMGKVYLPNPALSATAWGAFVTAISAVNDGMAYVFQAPMTGTIDSFKFWTQAVTTGGTIDARLETIDDTTGNPTGTLKGTNTNAAVTISTAPLEMTATLTAGASVTKGDRLAIVLRQPASSAPNYSVKTSGELLAVKFPYADRQISGTWTKSSSDFAVAIHYSDSGGSYQELVGGHSISAATAPTTIGSFQSGSNPNRYGNKFVAPGNINVTGAWCRPTITANANYTLELYDSGNNVIASYAHDGTDTQAATTAINYYEFTAPVVLTQGATYRITIRATAAVNVALDYQSLSSAALLGSSMGAGIFTRTSSGNGSTWTDTATDVMHIGIIVDGIDLNPSVSEIDTSY